MYHTLPPDKFPLENLRVIVEHLALYDYLLRQGYSMKSLKAKIEFFIIKSSEMATNNLLPALQELHKRIKLNAKKIPGSDDVINENIDLSELHKILSLLDTQLHSTLKDTVKHARTKNNKSADVIDLKVAKQLFEIVLRGTLVNESDVEKKLLSLINIITNMCGIYN